MLSNIIHILGLIGAVALRFWDIPLIVRIIKRRSSKDVSLFWVIGVWVCFVLMAPSGFTTKDMVWRVFNITNLVLFTAVFVVVLVYYNGRRE